MKERFSDGEAAPKQTVGVIGGGQLAWMMAMAAARLDLDLIVQTPNPTDPALALVEQGIFAPVADVAATGQLSDRASVITFENEFVDLDGLQVLADRGVCFRPSLASLRPLLDKYEQRQTLARLGLPTPQFGPLTTPEAIAADYGFPVVVKARRHGYDGRGTFIVKDEAQLRDLWPNWRLEDLLVEAFIPFERELAVMVARGLGGEVRLYPVVETVQVDQVCRRVFAPAAIPESVVSEVGAIATTLITALDVVGICGIEFFLTADGRVLVNEIAPRTHNSGHYSLEACDISQFEMQLRAVTGQPLPEPQWCCGGAVMVNLLGFEVSNSDYLEQREAISQIPGAVVRWYGKGEAQPGRKLGHVTVCFTPEQWRERETMGTLTQVATEVENYWYGQSRS